MIRAGKYHFEISKSSIEPPMACRRLQLHRTLSKLAAVPSSVARIFAASSIIRSAKMFKRHTSLKLQSLLFAAVLIGLTGQTLASLTQSAQSPTINVQACAFDAGHGRLTLKGANFQKGPTVSLPSAAGQSISYRTVQGKSAAKPSAHSLAER